MKGYLNFFLKVTQIQATTFLNGLWFWLRRVPLIGKSISPKFYAAYDLKTGLTVILKWLKLPVIVFNKSLQVLVTWGVSAIVYNVVTIVRNMDKETNDSFQFAAPEIFHWTITIFFLFCLFWQMDFIVASNGKMFKNIDFAKRYRLSYQETLVKFYRMDLVTSSLAYVLPFLILGLGYRHVFVAIVVPIVLRLLLLNLSMILVAQHFWIKVIDFLHGKFMRWIFTGALTMLYFAITVYCTVVVSMQWTGVLTWISLVLAILTSFKATKLGFTNEFIERIFIKKAYTEEVFAKLGNQNMGFTAAEKSSQKIEATNEQEIFERYSGGQLLNHLLFKRYSKIFKKKLFYRLAALVALFLVVIVGYLYLKFTHATGAVTVSEKDVYVFLPSLFVVLYLTSLSKEIVSIYYLRCDKAMLNYPFYRTKQAILQSFADRLKQSFILNTPIVLGLLINIFTIIFLFGKQISMGGLALILFYGVAVNLLFSFHELFLYYILQPFDKEGLSKNPIFSFINGAFYLFCIQNYNFQTLFSNKVLYVAVVSIVIVLYVIVGFITVQKKAPQTFRLK
ncbi:hypothetical protein SAMN02745116_00753 [Pilibacter termitis]|uniref:Uncharacterized protein n=1 Tax=Pilibacter termitis TaxID=263852 RepID=A0A1T4LPM6_9ENTE|nr:hypothetical protein [Pilibacter termitis]SJZ56623.1 hypothetical protein SAMN02745116_00753 [Pilibacter termitis]